MYCNECGNSLPDGVERCPVCGSKVKVQYRYMAKVKRYQKQFLINTVKLLVAIKNMYGKQIQ